MFKQGIYSLKISDTYQTNKQKKNIMLREAMKVSGIFLFFQAIDSLMTIRYIDSKSENIFFSILFLIYM